MNKLNMNKIYRLFFSLIFCLLLFTAGCGTGPDSATPTPTPPTPTPATASLTLSIDSNVVTFGTPQTATATLTDANGAVVHGAVVTFAASSDIVTFTPTSATALTNASGVASVGLNAASYDSTGATSIIASATFISGGTISSVTSLPLGIAVNGAVVTLGDITLGAGTSSLSPISAYGSSSVSVPVLIDGSAATVPISVTFTSPCVASGKATLTSPVTSVAGTVISTYTDNGCGQTTDEITASVVGDTASATIHIAEVTANNIQFVSATPEIIGTKTASAPTLSRTSIVKFKVVDSNNNGKAGVLVSFRLVPANAPGGITLSSSSATSDSNGEVTTTVNSGTIPTPLWVVAEIDDPAISSQSNTLRITTGLPTQNFFSFGIQIYNIEGLDYDGEESALTVIASDRLGNPVPNGTAINFITEGSQITPASCTTTDGACSVKFRTSEFRPSNGRVSILAYALGEKSFIDSIHNNTYDTGETFYDLGDLYVDANENDQWDALETYIPSTISGSSPCGTQPGAGSLPDNYWNALSKQDTCTALWGNNYVRRNAVIVLSGSSAYIDASTPTNVHMASSCSQTFDFLLQDVNGNPMPAGAVIAIGSNNVYYEVEGFLPGKPALNIEYGSPVPNTNHLGGTSFGLTVTADCSGGEVVAYPEGTVNLKVTTPKGVITTIPITVVNP